MLKVHTARIYNWAQGKAQSSRAPLWLGLLFALELVLFVPLDPLLIFFCSQERKKTFLYIAIASVASLWSGIVGYLIGNFLWDLVGPYVVPHLISAHLFEKMSHHFQLYEGWAVFFGSFIPFPLKALSLAAGVFDLQFFSYVVALFLARLIRFSLIGGAMLVWGEKVKTFIDRHFHNILLIVGGKLALLFSLIWFLVK